MTPITYYQNKVEKQRISIAALELKSRRVSILRFISILVLLILEFKATEFSAVAIPHSLAALALLSFIWFVRMHQKIQKQLSIEQAYLTITSNELAFVQENKQTQFETGIEFLDPKHAYANDLDILGQNSLYQHISRAHTVLGKQKIAHWLLFGSDEITIRARQEAVRELSNDRDWMDSLQVACLLGKDSPEIIQHLANWQKETHALSWSNNLLSVLLPLAGLSSMIMLAITQDSTYLSIGTTLFFVNLGHFSLVSKYLFRELGKMEKLASTFSGYAKVIASLENKSVQSSHLTALKNAVHKNEEKASVLLENLSVIFGNLESVQNGFAMATFNGTIQFHVHIYRQLLSWKKKNSSEIMGWLEVIAELEALNSLANFHANHPDSHFPKIQSDAIFSFEDLSHPLLNPETRVANSIDFTDRPFTILTGSNMSGKSTFLRTVGVAIVLSNAGSAILAKKAICKPIQLAASMRLSDSLSDSASYFYAEVRRLEYILEMLQKQPTFVLLDEILRGTNSDDKQTGTIGVIERYIQFPVFGIIATHDLEVCATANKYPDRLVNRCFEVELRKEDLHFDYTLRDGICKNKSATFIMKKHGIIID
jgi:DNA mismatch repair ATPase MutS